MKRKRLLIGSGRVELKTKDCRGDLELQAKNRNGVSDILVAGVAGPDSVGFNAMLIAAGAIGLTTRAGRRFGLDGLLLARWPAAKLLRLVAQGIEVKDESLACQQGLLAESQWETPTTGNTGDQRLSGASSSGADDLD